jgi:hypothetical protein
MIGIIFLIVYVVVAIMLIAYGNVVHKKHRFEDLWYKTSASKYPRRRSR